MVFLNMGGPSTTDEVGDFLSRLFVGQPLCKKQFSSWTRTSSDKHAMTGRRRPYSPRKIAELHRSPHLQAPDAQDPETICGNWRGLAHPEMV